MKKRTRCVQSSAEDERRLNRYCLLFLLAACLMRGYDTQCCKYNNQNGGDIKLSTFIKCCSHCQILIKFHKNRSNSPMTYVENKQKYISN